MSVFLQLIKGKKTYLVVCLMIIYVVLGIALGFMDNEQAGSIFLEALAIAGLRNSLQK